MPIFEFECKQCERRFEELMRRTDPDPACPSCGNREVVRLISHTSFQLKGTGWYVSDYGKQRSGNGSNGKSGEHSDGKGAAPASSDKAGGAGAGEAGSGTDGHASKAKTASSNSAAAA